MCHRKGTENEWSKIKIGGQLGMGHTFKTESHCPGSKMLNQYPRETGGVTILKKIRRQYPVLKFEKLRVDEVALSFYDLFR